MSEDLNKAVGLPESIDPTHTYVFRSGAYGLYQFWYKDMAGNYWRYTNAPEDSEDYDPRFGEALISPDQPMPHTSPQFFTEEGFKRHVAVPEGMKAERNEAYNPVDSANLWFEAYSNDDGLSRYVYLDADVKENLDLWVQHQLRVVDAGLTGYRKYAVALFQGDHPKDRITGALLILADQAYYRIEDLLNATVSELEFTDNTVKLLGRKFVCDVDMLDFLTSLKGERDDNDPLFYLDTVHGREALGNSYMYAVFFSLRVSSNFLMYWHATHLFSRIVNRLALSKIPAEELETKAFDELGRALSTDEDVSYLVDYKVKETLFNNYSEGVEKSFTYAEQDDYGIPVVLSDLEERRPDEMEFSKWLHAEPMHQITPEEEAAIEESLAESDEEDPNGEGVDQPKEPTAEGVDQPDSPSSEGVKEPGEGEDGGV